jgi:hypothetical protein
MGKQKEMTRSLVEADDGLVTGGEMLTGNKIRLCWIRNWCLDPPSLKRKFKELIE